MSGALQRKAKGSGLRTRSSHVTTALHLPQTICMRMTATKACDWLSNILPINCQERQHLNQSKLSSSHLAPSLAQTYFSSCSNSMKLTLSQVIPIAVLLPPKIQMMSQTVICVKAQHLSVPLCGQWLFQCACPKHSWLFHSRLPVQCLLAVQQPLKQ